MIIQPEDKEIFLKTLNKKGFLLEDKVWKILEGADFQNIERNITLNHNDERVEIDFLLINGRHHLVGECKRTDYSWFFAKASERSNTLNLIHQSQNKFQVKTRGTSDFKTAWTDLEVLFKDDGRLEITQQGFVKTSKNSEENIHKAIKQVLKETEAYIYSRGLPNSIIIPIIVTNADLYYIDYSKGDIDSKGDLTNYDEIKKIKGLVYNFPEIIKYGVYKSLIQGISPGILKHNVKSVFIVNVEHLKEFIDLILEQDI